MFNLTTEQNNTKKIELITCSLCILIFINTYGLTWLLSVDNMRLSYIK